MPRHRVPGRITTSPAHNSSPTGKAPSVTVRTGLFFATRSGTLLANWRACQKTCSSTSMRYGWRRGPGSPVDAYRARLSNCSGPVQAMVRSVHCVIVRLIRSRLSMSCNSPCIRRSCTAFIVSVTRPGSWNASSEHPVDHRPASITTAVTLSEEPAPIASSMSAPAAALEPGTRRHCRMASASSA